MDANADVISDCFKALRETTAALASAVMVSVRYGETPDERTLVLLGKLGDALAEIAD